MSSESVEWARSRLAEAIQPFRPVALKLLNLASGEFPPLKQVADLLASDAVLMAQVLRLANSPLLGRRIEITDALQAVVYLGMDRINSLIVTTYMRSMITPASGEWGGASWRHNLATAVICEQCAKAIHINRERGYLAGLLHDIGQLAMLHAFPDYAESLREAAMEGRNTLAVERSLYGMDHAEVGGWLLSQWGCPPYLRTVAAHHENPPTAAGEEWDVVRLVGAASQAAELIGFFVFPGSDRNELEKILESVPELGAEIDDLQEMTELVGSRINAIELILG